MGCDYCVENETVLERKNPLTQISIEDGSLVAIDGFGLFAVKINFCPMCGSKIKEGETDA